jgi:molybdenum cofactor guanylyltransferase
MGTDKSRLVIEGVPLIARIIACVREICPALTVVGHPARYSDLSVPVVPDAVSGQGPLAGIETALRLTDADWNLILACDMPALDSATLAALFAAASECDAVVPRTPDGEIEPLCAVYHRRSHPIIAGALASGVRKVRSVLPSLAIRYLSVDRADVFTNLNTPEDLALYRNTRGGHG